MGIVGALGDVLIHELLSTHRHCLIIVVSAIATPFSRCRAFCRYLLRAGHATLPAARFRRLRGGMFGWKHKGGPVTAALTYGSMHGRPDSAPEEEGTFDEQGAEWKIKAAEVVD